jgi:hypothetical protein
MFAKLAQKYRVPDPLASTSLAPLSSTPSSGSGPTYTEILTTFYQTHNPKKVGEVVSTLEKYEGREQEMFAKLAQKYRVPDPLASTSSPATAVPFNASHSPFSSGGGSSQAASPFSGGNQSQNVSPFMSTTGPATGQSSFGNANATNASPAAPAFGSSTAPSPSPFGSSTTPSQSLFGSSTAPPPSPFGQSPSVPANASPFGGMTSQPSAPSPVAPPGAPGGALFGGQSPRDLLTSFYQQKNPSKLAEIDKVLAKYQGNEELLFRNLCKKYNLDPSAFGLPAAPAVGGFGGSASSIAPSPVGFGQPSALGGFGQTPATLGGGGGAFGSPAAPPANTGYGAAPPSSAFGGSSPAAGFGASGFGSLAQSTPSPGYAGFGSPSGGPAPAPFGATPFGAPRR